MLATVSGTSCSVLLLVCLLSQVLFSFSFSHFLHRFCHHPHPPPPPHPDPPLFSSSRDVVADADRVTPVAPSTFGRQLRSRRCAPAPHPCRLQVCTMGRQHHCRALLFDRRRGSGCGVVCLCDAVSCAYTRPPVARLRASRRVVPVRCSDHRRRRAMVRVRGFFRILMNSHPKKS